MGFLLIDLSGLRLSQEERELLAHPAIAAVIFFTRNYQNINQLRELTREINTINPNLLLTVDQEGGRVQRFRDQFTRLPSMRHWGELYQKDPVKTLYALEKTIIQMAEELAQVGIYADLMPVLDLDLTDSTVIGERSLGSDQALVTELGFEILKYLKRNKLLSAAKHFPGHGGVKADSHFTLPVDERPLSTLLANDLMPYRVLLPELDAIMPAHVLYPAVDAKYSAGFSSIWLQSILREQLGFTGVIISDDVSMKATECYGDYSERVGLALQAGVDIVSLCNHREAVFQVVDQFSRYKNAASDQRIGKYIRKYV